MNRTDGQLLDDIAVLYAALDPAPDDLADGVLARLAVEDLEADYELLTLVEQVDHASGTRGPDVAAPDADTTVALEFAGTSYRVLVRISTVDGRRRLDGWVVPPAWLRVSLGSDDDPALARQSTESDADGRFEFPDPVTGRVRLWLTPLTTDESGAPVAPFVTPPFLL